MKTQLKRFSKSTISVLLAVCLLFSCMTVGIIATSAAQDNSAKLGAVDDSEALGYSSLAGRIYFDNTKTSWSNVYLYVGHSGYGRSYGMTSTGYNNIWYIDFSDSFTDRTKLYFCSRNDSPNGQNISIDTHHTWPSNAQKTDLITASNSDSGSIFTPSSNSNGTLTRSVAHVVAGTIASNGWNDCTDYMGTTNTKTYSNVAAGEYSLAVVKFYNNWSPSYRWSAKGTLTANNIASWADAGDGDHNIKLTTTQKANVTITLNSSNKVDITVSPVSTTYTGITAVAKGTTDGSSYSVSLGTIQSSTSVNSSTGLAVSAGSYDNYTFSKWVASGSGTFDNANSASTTFHPAANSEVATAQYKRSYSVTKDSPSNGTITLSKTTVLAGDTFKVTLAPSSGYRVATFTVGGVDKKSSLNASNEYTHTASGTGTSFAVRATFEAIPGTTIYIKKTVNTSDGFSYIHLWEGASTTNISDAGSWPGDKFTSWSSTSDGKYYYKTYTWDCATFKFILNNNNNSQTSDSDAYATGTSYYINSATANQKGVLTEGTPTAKAITYTSTYSSDPDVTWGGTKPSTAYPGETVSFTATAKSGYRISSVKYNDGSDHTLTASSGTYSFTMPASAVTVTVTTVKTYTVTLTAGTGIASIQYKKNSSGTYASYTSGTTLTVDTGTDVYFKVTYTSGYEYASNSGLTVVTANTEFRTGSVTAAKSVSITAQKITWSGLTAVGKYSTTGTSGSYTNTWSSGGPNVTIASTSATQLDGTTVTAPATVTVGNVKYTFVDFIATSGSVGTVSTSGSNKTTTFKPTAANAVCTARYKKVYTITSSVNSTNATGVGTVSTSVSEVAAGGSYTITAAPGSHSGVESITVNGTSKGTSASTTVSSVTANQTVVVKFKSKVLLMGTMNPTQWAGEEMTSNAAGTSFTITKTLNASTTYQFRLYADDAWKENSVTTWALNGVATHSTSGDNLTITPSVKVNVTFVSDGTKFTSITAVPYDSTTYNVTLKKVAGSTITCTYMGTEYTTASADAVVPVYSGTEISFTVTPASDKYLSGLTSSAGTLSPAFAVATHSGGYTGKIASVAAASTITPTVANKLKVTCTTNKVAWGTVTANAEYAKPGDTITLTYTPASGTLKTLTAYNTTAGSTIKVWQRDSSGDMKVVTGASANQATQVGITGLAGSIYSFLNKAGEALGASDDSAALGADDALTFTMPSGAVTVTATYEEYVGTSDYVYHGYNTSGQAVSGYENEAMAEGSIGGQKYAYYNVTGREGSGYDQLFYISKGSTETRYVYFTDKGGTYADWANHDPTAYFYNSSGAVGDAWPGKAMTWISGEGSNVDKNWKLEIPAGATGVIFTNGKSSGDFKQTQDIDLTNTNGSYYPSGYSDNKYTVTQWDTPGDHSGLASGTDYYYSNTIYTDQWWTGGFNNHNAGNPTKNYIKPKDGNGQTFSECKDDYYIVVLYPNTTYTFSVPGHENHSQTVGAEPMVLWMKNLPGQSETVSSTVKVYAKDGAIRRDGDTPERNNMTYSYFEQHANTFVYSDSGYASHIGTRSSHDGQTSEGTGYNGYTYDYIQKFEKGQTLYIKTNMDSTLLANHYLVAYSINGKCYKLHGTTEGDTNGYVTEAFTVPEDFEDNYIEITPIYFPKDASNCITFYIEGYDETVMNAGWGNTPYVYPFYQDGSNNYVANINNAFGGYPGQPMVFYQGNYYTMLPKQYTTTPEGGSSAINCSIKGVTLGNGYWDDIHILTGEVSSHFQTYDYDDLYKIYKEKNNADHIICAFKYRTKKNNDEPSSMSSSTAANYNSTNGNGWEVLTDYYGQPVDVFGNVLTGTAKTLAESIIAGTASAESSAVVHAISQDYKVNSAGDYGTEWAIYNTAGTKVVATSGGKTTIVPSALAINNSSNFANYDSATKAFQSIYDALKADTNVVGKPVVVTYEKSIYGGSDKADRCDARWYFSQTDYPITATTRIEYTDDGKTWTTDTYNSGTGTGSHTGAKAYFTGKASTATDTPTDTSGVSGENTTSLAGNSGAGYYTFKAVNNNGANGNYEFVGWYLLRDNYQNISVRSSYASDASQFPSHAQQSKNGDIFVARFKKTATGTFDIYHEVHPQTSGYGHVYVEAIVKDSGGTQQGSKIGSISGGTLTDHVQIPTTYIRSGEGYTVEATFKADPYGTSNFEAFYATVSELLDGYTGYDFIRSITVDTANKTATVIYDVDKLFSVASGDPVQTVTSVTHYSKFSLKTDLKYSLTYTFNTRYYGTKLYKYTNENFTEQELKSYFYSQITNDSVSTITIDKQFVQRKAPFESNYREDLTWNVDNVTVDGNTGSLTATQVPATWANAVVYDFHNDGTFFTYQMAAPYDNLFKKAVQAKPADASEAASAAASWNDPEITFYDLYDQGRWTYTESGETKQIYIDHWDIYQLDSFTYNTSNGSPQLMDDGINLDVDTDKSVLVAQTYSARFNYIGYEDYAIVPVYSKTYVDRQGESDDRTDCSATLLTITRNHWNETASGNTQGGKYKDSADRIYVDFMLNYNYSKVIDGKNTNVQLSTTGDNIKVGFIIKSYTVTNTGTESVKTYSGKSQVVMVDKSDINNKNRLEYCYGFNNSQNNSKWGQYYEFTPFIIDTNAGTTESEDGITLPDSAGGGKYLSICKDTVTPLDNVTFYRIGNSDVSWAS